MPVFTINRKLTGCAGVVLLALCWQIGAVWLNQPLLVPTPLAALRQIRFLAASQDFWRHLGASLLRGAVGFGLSFAAGAILGFCAGKAAWLSSFLRPISVFIRSTPSMTLIILALLWFKGDMVAIFVVFLVVFPIVFRNVEDGVSNLDSELEEMIDLYQIKQGRKFTAFYLPGIMPFLAAAAASGLGMTWKVLIAAEVLAVPAWGIGAQLDAARLYLQTDKVFAWTVIVIGIGLCFDYLLDFLLRKSFWKWKESKYV
jgi:NitT/TauT family transport system permease protein